MTPAIPRLFVLRRDTDVTGVSGPGDVADGVQWADGTVALRWRKRPSTSMWDSLELMLSVHGHDGATHVVWLDEQQAQRARTTADIAQAFGVPLNVIDPDAERDYLRDRVGRALATAAESSTWGEGGEAQWVHLTGYRDNLVNAVMPVVDQLVEQRNRAQRTAGRAYQLADRWQAAHGLSMFLVRAAGAELRDELDGTEECDHRLMPMLSGIVPGGPCVVRGTHIEHKTTDGTVFTAMESAAEPCTKHRGREERQRYGCNGPDPADQDPLKQGPLAGIEVRDPCPYCEGCPLIPRTLMDDHVREHHPEVRDDGVVLAREALLARVGDEQADAVDRLIRAVERRAACDLPHETEV
ncbi:hypothetical protein [Streptomyces sp. NPDC045251]|uniref:hypothetical protein n=1 Tax=unclassified Streptomyces TaxID=2593676 RepID=UPI0033F40888